MSRIIEVVLFLAPFVAFATWRLLFRGARMPLWLPLGLGVLVLALLGLLLTEHLRGAADAHRPYVPATMQDGRIVPGHAGAPR